MSHTGNVEECPFCGLYHNGRCRQIKSIEYFANGTIKKIVYENGQQDNERQVSDEREKV